MRSADEHYERFYQSGLVWYAHADTIRQLREEIIPSLSEVAGFIPLKETATRLILKSKQEEIRGSFIVKIFKSRSIRDRLKNLFRSPRSLKEWRVGLALLNKGISAPLPIAAGVPRRFLFSENDYFISHEIIGAQSLAEWMNKELFQGTVPFPEKRVVIKTLAAFVRTLHDSGVYSTDLHPGNILIKTAQGETPRFYLTDFHAIRFRDRLSLDQRVHNLVQLDSFHLSTADRLRFLTYCFQSKEEHGIATKERARTIGAASQRYWKALWKKRRRRALRETKGIERFAIGQWRGMILKGWNSMEFQQLLKSKTSTVFPFESKKIKEDSRTLIEEVALAHLKGSEPLVVKYYHDKGLLAKLEAAVRMSRAQRAWVHAHQLLMRGIPTPTPVAFGEKRHWGIRQGSIFVTRKIPAAQGSDVFLKELPQQFTDQEQECLKKSFLVKLARMIRWMHITGICHGDLKASNILVARDEKDLSVFLVDMDGVKMRNTLRVKAVAKDLSRLKAAFAEVLSPSDYEYFLNIYRRGNVFFQTHEKRILEMLHILTAEKIRKKQLAAVRPDIQ